MTTAQKLCDEMNALPDCSFCGWSVFYSDILTVTKNKKTAICKQCAEEITWANKRYIENNGADFAFAVTEWDRMGQPK
jgi:transcription elongation factor Elf1